MAMRRRFLDKVAEHPQSQLASNLSNPEFLKPQGGVAASAVSITIYREPLGATSRKREYCCSDSPPSLRESHYPAMDHIFPGVGRKSIPDKATTRTASQR